MNVLRAAAIAAALSVVPALPSVAETPNRPAPQQDAAPQPQVQPQQGQMSETMVRKVGTALRHVVAIRQQYAQRAQSTNPGKQEALSGQAESEMVRAISDQGLSLQQYDQVIQMAQADPALRQRILTIAQASD